jgi:hypothetical protein
VLLTFGAIGAALVVALLLVMSAITNAGQLVADEIADIRMLILSLFPQRTVGVDITADAPVPRRDARPQPRRM